jgi:hypothetical protein
MLDIDNSTNDRLFQYGKIPLLKIHFQLERYESINSSLKSRHQLDLPNVSSFFGLP